MDSRRSSAPGTPGIGAPAAHGAGPTRALLLAPRGYDAPLDLLDGLRRRGVAVREVTDAATVMVALAGEVFVSLIILEPGSVAEAGALYHAVRRYHPQVPVWQYRWSGEPRLGHYSNGHVAAAAGAPAAPVSEASELPGANGHGQSGVEAGMKMFTEPGPAPAPAGARMTEEEVRSAAALTEEELAMLLEEPEERRGESA